MNKKEVLDRYRAAFRSVHGAEPNIQCRGGRYFINEYSTGGFLLFQIDEMAANLEFRAERDKLQEGQSMKTKRRHNRLFYLKTDPDVFEFSWHGSKTFEIRFNDRDFEVGDHLVLRETVYSGEQMRNGHRLEYTGRQIEVEVIHILFGPIYGLLEGWVIMSLKMIWFGLVGAEESQNEN